MSLSVKSPTDYSSYERTGNNAIDLVAQAIGFNRAAQRPLKAIYLSYGKWHLFVEGMKILQAMRGESPNQDCEYVFEGVQILQGSRMQIADLRYEYRKLPKTS